MSGKFEELRRLRLPRGYAKTIAERCNCSPKTVRSVRLCHHYNAKIALELIWLAERYEAELQLIQLELKRYEEI